MQKGQSGMGSRKHGKSGIHGHPVHESVKMDVERKANSGKKARPEEPMHSSIKELMKNRQGP